MKAQPITCDFFCATDITMLTDTSMQIDIFMKGTPQMHIHMPYVAVVTDINGDTVAGSDLGFFGHTGGQTYPYTVKTTWTNIPANFKGTVYLSYYYLLNDSTFAGEVCPLPYPCISTDIYNNFSLNEIHVYPVPLNPSSPLHIDGNVPSTAYFKVVDLTGREVQQQPIVSSTLQLDENKLANGIYLYVIGDGNQILKTGKLVVNYQIKQ